MRARSFAQVWLVCIALHCFAQQSPDFDRLLQEGSALSQRADYIQAIALLRQATNLEPQNPAANYLLGLALLQSGHPADAIHPLRVATRAVPINDAAEGYLGDAEMEIEEFALAADAFLSAISHSPDSDQTLVWWTDFSLERYRRLEFSLRGTTRGRAALLEVAAQGDELGWKKKEELLRQAASLDASLGDIRSELGVAQALLGEEANAQDSLRSAQETSPDAISTLKLHALVDAAQGRWNEATAMLVELKSRSQTEFKRTVAAWPPELLPSSEHNGPLRQCLRERRSECLAIQIHPPAQDTISAKRLFYEGRWEELIAVPAPSTNDAAMWYWRGMAFAQLGDCIHAIPALERGLTTGEVIGSAQLSSCYEREAVRSADRLQALGKEASVHLIRGDILLSIRLDPAKASAEYKQALGLKPKDPQLLEKLAESYYSQGEMAEAQQAAKQALELNPSRRQLLRLLIEVAISERDYSTALSLLGRLAGIDPDDPWICVQRATAYAETGHPEEAVQALQPTLNAGYPDKKGSLHALLAAQLRKLGRIEEASRATEEAIRLADSFAQQNQNAPAPHAKTDAPPR